MSALVSSLIQKWAHEYPQYLQASGLALLKRGRVRASLFEDLSSSK